MPSLEDLTTDQLLAHARALEGSHKLVATLSGDPKTRESLQRLIKLQNPSAHIPELETRDLVREELKTRDEQIEKLQNTILEGQITQRLEKQRAAAQAQFRLSDDEMLEVEKLMTHADPDQRIPGYMAAARVFAASKQNAAPTPASLSSPTFEMPESDVWGKGIGNKQALDKIALNEAFSAWNDVTSGKVAA
jgi:hypothetical protein